MELGYRTLLHDPLAVEAQTQGNKLAVVAEDASLSYSELDGRSSHLARWLQSRGLERGDRVGIFLDNTADAAVSIYGVLKAGGVFVPVNPLTKHEKLAFIADDCGVRALISDVHQSRTLGATVRLISSLKDLVLASTPEQGEVGELGNVRVSPLPTILSSAVPGEAPPPKIIPSDLAVLIYTSGSTGEPKGVVHTHQSSTFAMGSVREYLGLRGDDVVLNVLPLAFDYGLYQLLMSVSRGATLVLERSFAYPGQVFKRMREYEVTVFPGVPTIFSGLISAHRRNPLHFPSVQTITNTAADLPTDFDGPLREIFPNGRIFRMYGLTECKRVSYLHPELADAHPGSVGKAIPGTEVFLRGPEGEPVTAEEPGILHVRGPHVMKGYWNRPEETREMLREGEISGEKILRTGDWFRMDAEGFLYFLGRSDDIIKSGGEKVSPVEVENALHSVPGVQEAAVVGVPDDFLGQALRAFVVCSPEADLDERSLRRALLARLEIYMVPREIVFRESLPKSANGKILRQELV